MAGFGGSPVAQLFSGLGEGISRGADQYMDLQRQRQQQDYVRQLMSLAASEEARKQGGYEFERSLDPFKFKSASQEPLLGDLRLRTGEEALSGAQETRALGGQYRTGLMGEGLSPTDAIAAFMGKPSSAAALVEPEMLQAELAAAALKAPYMRAQIGAMGRSGSPKEVTVEDATGRLTNETLQGIITQASRKRFHGQQLTGEEERLVAAAYNTLLTRQREATLAAPKTDDYGDTIGPNLLPQGLNNPFLPQQ